ncbi:MAG: radical SAM protein [Candidatus Omnitrophica bacterium]|nr:radical SAM protein [Candidatus Omnitrophota bacterium]
MDNEIIDQAGLEMRNDEVMNMLVRGNVHPDIVIVTTSSIDRWECPRINIDDTLQLLNRIKEKLPNVKIILYGTHVTTSPDWVIKRCGDVVDFFVKAEPELKVLEIVRYLLSLRSDLNIPGIVYKQNSEFIKNEGDLFAKDLDTMPFPAYKKLPMEIYKYNDTNFSQPFTIMVSSRGCPFRCTFCLLAMSPIYRARSAKNVLDEIEYLKSEFKIESIYFQDWEFLLNKERVFDIADGLEKRKVDINFGINARATDLDNVLVRKLKQVGLKRINIGLESASNKILKNVNKKMTLDDVKKAVYICKSENITAGFYTILNLPGENMHSLFKTAQFLAYNEIEPRISIVRYYPGSSLGNEVGVVWQNVLNISGSYRTQIKSSKIVEHLFKIFYVFCKMLVRLRYWIKK